MKPKRELYSLKLAHVGPVLEDTLKILKLYNRFRNWSSVRKQVIDNNILQKSTLRTSKEIFRAVKSRYGSPPEWLPSTYSLSQFVSKENLPKAAKAQLLLIYTLAKDQLSSKVHEDVILPAILEKSNVRNEDLRNYLTALSSALGVGWSASTIRVWAVHFKTYLRNAGFFNNNSLTSPVVRVEAFSFLILWQFFKFNSLRITLNHRTYKWLGLLSESQTRYLLIEGMKKGWWHFAEGGGVIEFIPHYKSLKEWLNEL